MPCLLYFPDNFRCETRAGSAPLANESIARSIMRVAKRPSTGQEEAMKIGSSPLSRNHKCLRCMPCKPAQIPATSSGRSHLWVQYANYEPEGWKCKCDPSSYSPWVKFNMNQILLPWINQSRAAHDNSLLYLCILNGWVSVIRVTFLYFQSVFSISNCVDMLVHFDLRMASLASPSLSRLRHCSKSYSSRFQQDYTPRNSNTRLTAGFFSSLLYVSPASAEPPASICSRGFFYVSFLFASEQVKVTTWKRSNQNSLIDHDSHPRRYFYYVALVRLTLH